MLLSFTVNSILPAIASKGRIEELLALEKDYEPENPKEIEGFTLEFKNVSFTYPSEKEGTSKVLENVSFIINEGETVGITGPTGSRKINFK